MVQIMRIYYFVPKSTVDILDKSTKVRLHLPFSD